VRHLRRALLACAAGLALSGPALADPALWKVSDADSEIYLFGSVHIFTREMDDWRSDAFDAILKSADHVVFEVVLDIEAYSTITQISFTKGRLTGGQSLSQLLSTEDYDKVVAAAGKTGIDMAMLEHVQPWLATVMLMGAAMPKASAGVETLLDAEVAPERKRGLETAAEQMGFFADAPLDEQIDGLISTADGIEAGLVGMLDPLIAAWESGDTAALHATMTEQIQPRDRAIMERLIDDRNQRWLTPIEKMLADNDESLLVVGAGHLVGPMGVPALLKERGYTVERVDEPPAGGPAATAQRPSATQRR
jgi:uncharacterized protein YbaP (TraB family)